MSTLICGSVAYDNIMVFHDRFKNHILPEQIHILNVAFLVPEMRREFGGCAGNIAYNLKLLGGDPLIMATVGDDAEPYLRRLDTLQLPHTHIRRVEGSFTAQAFITTDLDDNQITAFHPGAMSFSHYNNTADARDATLAIVAPDGRDGMLKHASDLAAFIKKHDASFNLLGACYPEGHYQAESLEQDIENLKIKIDSGVDHLITQLFSI